MEKKEAKEMVKNMEHLVELLHEEWERSGRTKAEISIDIADKKTIEVWLAEEIQERQKQLKAEELDFKASMAFSKENFVLLRLAKKIGKAGDRAEHMGNAVSFTVEMDQEEYRLYHALFQVWEV